MSGRTVQLAARPTGHAVTRRRRHPVLLVLGALCALVASFGLSTPASASPMSYASASVEANAIRGGDTLYSANGQCAVGFNAAEASGAAASAAAEAAPDGYYALMPGHCGGVGTQWYADPQMTQLVGVTDLSVFPSSDYALLRYTNTELTYPSEIVVAGQPVPVGGVANPAVGQAVCQSSVTTGVHCGTVTGVNESVSYPAGTVNGLFRANICTDPRNPSRGTVYADGTGTVSALGFWTTSTSCEGPGESYYQPVAPVLDAVGLTVSY